MNYYLLSKLINFTQLTPWYMANLPENPLTEPTPRHQLDVGTNRFINSDTLWF